MLHPELTEQHHNVCSRAFIWCFCSYLCPRIQTMIRFWFVADDARCGSWPPPLSEQQDRLCFQHIAVQCDAWSLRSI